MSPGEATVNSNFALPVDLAEWLEKEARRQRVPRVRILRALLEKAKAESEGRRRASDSPEGLLAPFCGLC